MPTDGPPGDTSLTLMMRIQRDPADAEAWDRFVQHYEPMIRAWCLRWGSQPSEAEDVAQDVLLKLLTSMKRFQYDPARSFRGWLKAVTRSAWNDFVSTQRRRLSQSPELIESVADSYDALADLEAEMEAAFHRELLGLAMRRVENRVKPITWQAFRLTTIDNRSGVQAAMELGIPVAHVFVAKRRVKKMLEEEIRLLKENMN